MDPSMYQMLPTFGQQTAVPYLGGGAPQAANLPQLGQQPQQHGLFGHGMFGNMSPMFGLMGMMSQSGMGLSPMFGLAGLGLHALKVI